MKFVSKILAYGRDNISKKNRENLHGTKIHQIYNKLQGIFVPLDKVSIDTEIGSVTLLVPETSNFGQSEYEPLMVDKLGGIINQDTVYYDIGSQYGFFCKLASLTGDESKIHGFEMDSFSFSVLTKNNPGGVNNNCRVGDEEEDEKITIDNYIKTHQSPDIVKIDVEGAEKEVLEGMDEVLSKELQLFIEVHPRLLPDFNTSIDEVVDMLERKGYDLTFFNHRSEDENELTLSEAKNLGNFALVAENTS